MGSPRAVFDWLVAQWQWPTAALAGGCLLLLIAPNWFHVAGPALGWVYLQLPLYMLHQWEEHAGDRFRLFVNQKIGEGREVLTPAATFWINALGVWAVDLASLGLAVFVDLSLGLVAIYLPLINALGHIAPAVGTRRYNPGLWTALALFFPAGGWGWNVVTTAAQTTWKGHVTGVGIALAIHAAIIFHVLRRRSSLSTGHAPHSGIRK